MFTLLTASSHFVVLFSALGKTGVAKSWGLCSLETPQLRWDSKPAKTEVGTWAHGLGLESTLFIDIAHLVSGLNEAQVLSVSAQRNSGRGKVIGKKWVSLECTLHRQNAIHLRKWETLKYRLGNFIGWWVGRFFQLFWENTGKTLLAFYGWPSYCPGTCGHVI